jgi:steroid delta-isomerase-like uncharacterized protein
MSTEENKTLVNQFLDAQHQGDLALVEKLMAPGFRLYLPNSPQPMDREGTKHFFAMFHAAFSDESYTLEDQMAEGDLVATRVTVRGTHQGEFMGIPPTNRQVTISGIGIHRITGGRITAHWPVPDLLGMMQQLGVIPAPGQSPG